MAYLSQFPVHPYSAGSSELYLWANRKFRIWVLWSQGLVDVILLSQSNFFWKHVTKENTVNSKVSGLTLVTANCLSEVQVAYVSSQRYCTNSRSCYDSTYAFLRITTLWKNAIKTTGLMGKNGGWGVKLKNINNMFFKEVLSEYNKKILAQCYPC